MDIILRIIGLTFRHKWYMIGAYTAMAGASVSYLFLPYLLGKAIDNIQSVLEGTSPADDTILILFILILGVSIIRGVLSFFQTYLGEAVSQQVSYGLRNEFYDRVQRLSFAFHDTQHTGKLMSRAITDVENIRMFVNMGVVRMPYFASLFVVVAIILVRLDTKLGLISISFLPFVAIQSALIRLKMRQLWLLIQDKMAELSTILQENLAGIRVVKAFGSEAFEQGKFNDKSIEVSDEIVRVEKLRVANNSFMLLAFYVSLGLILFYGGWNVVSGTMSLGMLAEFVFYMQILNMPIRMTGMIVNSYARAASAGERIFEILDLESPVKELSSSRKIIDVKGHVKFDNVTFGYNRNKTILKEINLEARPGEIVALLGMPGSGKTTLVNLLPRFYELTSGRVSIDNIDIKNFTLESLRSNIGMVQQDVFLFTSTIRENIAYGKYEASINDITKAAKIAQLHEFIESLPAGYDTVIGERGVTLSGGQRQRLSIARAILLDPPILILDDSTSSVDANTEEKIRKAMASVMSGRTTFIIAHRLSTVHRANKILVLRDGSVIEEGTHQELLDLDGAYKEIYDLQLKPQEEVLRDLDLSTKSSEKSFI